MIPPLNNYRVVHLTSAHQAMDIRIFHKECRSLAHAGYEVVIVGRHSCDQVIEGVRIRHIKRASNRFMRMTVTLLRICREAFLARADIYHIHDPELLIVGLLLRLSGKRVVYDIHEDVPHSVLFKLYLPLVTRRPLVWIVERAESRMARCMTGLIAATPVLAERFHRIHPNTVTVGNFVRLDEFGSAGKTDWSTRDKAVIYYGGISEARGIREILQATAKAAETLTIRLQLGGRFYENVVQSELMETPQWRFVDWHGVLTREKLVSLLGQVRAGLIILHPEEAYLSSLPTKLFEYMAAGIPVIASDFPLWRTLIEPYGCGLLVNPFDITAISEAIEYLVTNDREAYEMGQRGRIAAERRFSWSNEERALLSFYSSLLPARAAVQAKATLI
jgi:glycosyltransferase involved in cell wall biosynthesis